MKRLLRTRVLLIIVLVALCFLLVLTLYAEEMARVVSVVDGDTLTIKHNGNEESISLIGVDAPESTINRKAETEVRRTGESFLDIASKGIDAKRFVERIVKKGDMVALAFDVRMRDKEGRLLGYVYLPDGRMLNEEIVRAGYARVVTTPPNVKYRERFMEAYREARAYRRGLWKSP
jgi:micrococcal nuclease